jgi:hypothetical protein
MSDTEQALVIVREAAAKLEPLWDYLPHRPLGWLNLIIEGVLEELEYKAKHDPH